MGNHEWCSGCQQSDFHLGQTCAEAYPEQFKKVMAARVSSTDTIHERRSFIFNKPGFSVGERIDDTPNALPSPEDIRTLLSGKQYFDNDYRPAEWQQPVPSCSRFLRCACNRSDCPRCLESRRS